jgi:hypothetical protein
MGHQYVNGAKHQSRPFCSDKEIRALYIKVGWIGKWRVPHHFLKVVPFFDTGPGPDIGR